MLPSVEVDLPVFSWLEAAAGCVAGPCTSSAAVVPAWDGVAVDGLVSGDGSVVGVPVPSEPWRARVKSRLLPTLLLWLATSGVGARVAPLPRRLRPVRPGLLPTWLVHEPLIAGLSQNSILLPRRVRPLVLLALLRSGLLLSCVVLWLGLAGSVRLLLQGSCYQLFDLCFSEDGCCCCLPGCCCLLVEWAYPIISLYHGLGNCTCSCCSCTCSCCSCIYSCCWRCWWLCGRWRRATDDRVTHAN